MIIKRLEKEDLQKIKDIRNQYLMYLRQSVELNQLDQERWYESTNDRYFSIFDEKEPYNGYGVSQENLVGAVGITNIDLVSRKAELSLITENYADPIYAQSGLEYIMKYSFEDLNLHKLYITIYEYDYKKIELFENNRFFKEATLREDVLYDRKYWGHHYYSLLSREYYDLRDMVSNSLIYRRKK